MTVTNPAAPVILFALLSPFVNAERANVAWQLVQVGFIAALALLLDFCGYSVMATAATRWLRSERAHRLLGRVGAACIGAWALVIVLAEPLA